MKKTWSAPYYYKISPTEVIDIRSLPNGKTVWLETGSSNAGLIHIIEEHGAECAQRNLSESQIPDVLFTALEKGISLATKEKA